MSKSTLRLHSLLAACGGAMLMPLVISGTSAQPAPSASISSGGPLEIRRLDEAQYRNSISDIFGPKIKVEGRFEGEMSVGGLLAIGSSKAAVTSAGAEFNTSLASDIAGQIVAKANRAELVPCTPKSETKPDSACAQQFITKYGEALFRRPLTPAQAQAMVSLANKEALAANDFYAGLRFATMRLLISPEFLFRIERSANDDFGVRLDDWSRASRLSFLLWNGPPDQILLDAARTGDLSRPEGLRAQVDRLMASPRLERSMRAFFSDTFGLHAYKTLAKDSQIYPVFLQKIAASMQEQELRTIIDIVLTRDTDYSSLFTTRQTFLNRDLGLLYRLPVQQQQGWMPYEMPQDRAGILTWASFLALHSHPGRSSPTLRGVAVRDRILCQEIPAPPADVDFSVVQNVHDANLPTSRARLTAHMTNPTCASCHKLTDPIGFALEKFDGTAQFRAMENNTVIDTSGALGASQFTDAVGLGKAIAKDPAMPTCLVNRLVGYGLGRLPLRGERLWVDALKRNFVGEGMRVKTLLRSVAISDEFYKLQADRNKNLLIKPTKSAAL